MAKKQDSFAGIFTRYWDNIIIGVIAGLVVYYGTIIKNGFFAALFIFLFALLLNLVYSIWVLIDKKMEIDKRIYGLLLKIIGLIKKYSIIFVKWSNQKRKLLVFFVILVYLYSSLHEYIHYFMSLGLGHTGKISWGVLAHFFTFDKLQGVPYTHYFLIVMAPHFFNIFLMLILTGTNIFFPRSNNILAKISFFPFFDLLWNFLMMIPTYFTKGSDDFLNLIRIGFMKSTEAGIYSIIFMIILVVANIYLFRPFIHQIIQLLKLQNDKAKTKTN